MDVNCSLWRLLNSKCVLSYSYASCISRNSLPQLPKHRSGWHCLTRSRYLFRTSTKVDPSFRPSRCAAFITDILICLNILGNCITIFSTPGKQSASRLHLKWLARIGSLASPICWLRSLLTANLQSLQAHRSGNLQRSREIQLLVESCTEVRLSLHTHTAKVWSGLWLCELVEVELFLARSISRRNHSHTIRPSRLLVRIPFVYRQSTQDTCFKSPFCLNYSKLRSGKSRHLDCW